MSLSKFIIPSIFIVYGILLLNGVHLHRVYGTGDGWIAVGIFFSLLVVVIDYYDKKYYGENKECELENKNQDVSKIGRICSFLFWIGVVIMALQLFGIIDILWLILAVLLTLVCGKHVDFN